MNINPTVLDLSHHNEIDTKAGGFSAVYRAGIRGIIHKSSQGVGMTDAKYAARRKMATDAGLLWGAYHFADNQDVDAQVGHFIRAAQPDENTLMALDFEPNANHTMSIAQARTFLTKIAAILGRKAVLYSGNLAKEQLKSADPFFGSHRLWLSQYGAVPNVQRSWSAPWLWQFTGDGLGPKPHAIAGIIGNGIDINSYAGTSAQLATEWA